MRKPFNVRAHDTARATAALALVHAFTEEKRPISLRFITSLCTGHPAALPATAGAGGVIGGVSDMETRHSSSPSWSTSNEDSYSEREKVLWRSANPRVLRVSLVCKNPQVFSCSDEVSGEEEGGQYESQNTRKTADLQIYTELAAIRDKLKVCPYKNSVLFGGVLILPN